MAATSLPDFLEFKTSYEDFLKKSKVKDEALFNVLVGKYDLNPTVDSWNSEDAIKIMVLGDTGVGKSVICNALYNNTVEEYKHLFAPYVVGTTGISQTSSVNNQISRNGELMIYDTPGLGDNRSDSDDILYRLIYDITTATYIGLDKVVIVIKHGRFSKNINDTFNLIYDLFKNKLDRNIIIVHNYYDSGEPAIASKSVLQQLHESTEINPDFKTTILKILSLHPVEIQTTFLTHENPVFDNLYFQYRQKSLDLLMKNVKNTTPGIKFEVDENTLVNIVNIVGSFMRLPFNPTKVKAQLDRTIEENGTKVRSDFKSFWEMVQNNVGSIIDKIDWTKVLLKIV